MPRYTAQALEEKLAWMRERQQQHWQAKEAGLPHVSKARAAQRKLRKEIPAHLWHFRVDEVAQLLGASRRTIIRWFGGRCVKVGGGQGQRQIMLIPQQALEDWLREHAATAL